MKTAYRSANGRFAKKPTPTKIDIRTRKGQFQWITIGLREDSLYYVPDSHNQKTGHMPTQFIGATRDQSEETCRMCPLWKDNTCYSQDGSPRMGHQSVIRFVQRGNDRNLQQALDNRRVNAKYVRLGSIGDPGSIAPDVYVQHEQMVRDAGLGVISYTHQWYLDHAQHLKGHALASCDNMKDVKDAVAVGWRTAVHVDENASVFNGKTITESPQGKLDNGVNYFLCPAQRTDNKTTCNDCGLCDGTKPMKYNTIVFVEHGQQMKFKKQREARKDAE